MSTVDELAPIVVHDSARDRAASGSGSSFARRRSSSGR